MGECPPFFPTCRNACYRAPQLMPPCLQGEVSDHVLMEGRGFGFVTFADPQNAKNFLDVRAVLPSPAPPRYLLWSVNKCGAWGLPFLFCLLSLSACLHPVAHTQLALFLYYC